MKKWLTRLLFDWVFVLLYRLFQAFLNLVDFIESFFDIFAGTAKVFYKGNSEFLINIFFGHNAVTNAFWAMALIAIVLAFGFCIVQVSRKAADVTGSVKQSVGQIMSNFFRCMVIILLLNFATVTVINITNVLLDRINYALENAAVLNQQEADKTFSDQEYAAMTRILATVANYSVNPSADSRYNINSCFNAIRPDLLSLYVNGFFRYDYPLDANGHYTWQGALALLAASADLTTDLKLETYYADVASAVQTVSRELNTYRDFAPVERAHFSVPESIDTDILIFLIAGMEASQNSMYNTGDFNDALRKGYVSGEKDYNNLKQVRKDFDIWEMDYLVGYIACIVFIIIMAICIFTFIVRMFNLLLLYLSAPLFASSMPMDDGGKWQSWTQAFVIQLFSGFGMVVAMRLYLIIIPIIISSDLVFFAGSGLDNALLNRMAQLLMVLGGAWAVLQAGAVITGILAGNPGMAAIQQEGRIGSMVTGWAMRAPRAALGTAKKLMNAPMKAGRGIQSLKDRLDAHHDKKSQNMSRKALRQQNKADALFDKADKKLADGKSGRSVQRTMDKASRAQRTAAGTADKLAHRQAKYGQAAYQSKKSYKGFGSADLGLSGSGSSGGFGGFGSSGGTGGTGGPDGSSGGSRTAHTVPVSGSGPAAGSSGPASPGMLKKAMSSEGVRYTAGGKIQPKRFTPPRAPAPMERATRSEGVGYNKDGKIQPKRFTPPPPPPPPAPGSARARDTGGSAGTVSSGGGASSTASGGGSSTASGGSSTSVPPPARARAAASSSTGGGTTSTTSAGGGSSSTTGSGGSTLPPPPARTREAVPSAPSTGTSGGAAPSGPSAEIRSTPNGIQPKRYTPPKAGGGKDGGAPPPPPPRTPR